MGTYFTFSLFGVKRSFLKKINKIGVNNYYKES